MTVSLKEAQRLDSETKIRLLADRKLSLIVDLDQTIVHATVDPTVGEWMDDQANPNWEVLQGVGRFQLADPTAPPRTVPDADHCWYYLKKRCVALQARRTTGLTLGAQARTRRLSERDGQDIRDAHLHHGHPSVRDGGVQIYRPDGGALRRSDTQSRRERQYVFSLASQTACSVTRVQV